MTGALSGMIGSMKGATAPTTAPTSLSAIPTNTNVAISFTPPSNDGGSAITNYEYSFNNSTWTALSPADAISPITVSGLTQNTAYSIYLRAVNVIGSGPASSAVTFTTAGVPTGAATISSVTVGTTTATVNFSVAAGGGAVTGYDLYVTNYTNAWNDTTASPISVTGLTPNTAYTFYVRAKNAYGVGPQSAGVGATTNPTFISATGGTTVDYTSGGFGYRSHTFTGNGNFVVSSVGSFGTIDLHMIGGGGGGGYSYGSGGGGGGARTDTSVAVSATTYAIVIGGAGHQGQDVGSGAYGGVGGTTTGFSLSVGGGGGGPTNIGGGSAAAPGNGGGGGGANINGVPATANGSYGSAGGGPGSGYGGGNGGSGYNQPNAYRTGSNETRATGGLGSTTNGYGAPAGSGYGAGGGGGGIYCNVPYRGGNASAGAVILRYRIS